MRPLYDAMVSLCVVCGENKPVDAFPRNKSMSSGRDSRCKSCGYANYKAWVEANRDRQREINRASYARRRDAVFAREKERRKDTPEIFAARDRLKKAVKRGQVERATHCQRCGMEAFTEGHHEDYSSPLDVIWLCVGCHRRHHVVSSVM